MKSFAFVLGTLFGSMLGIASMNHLVKDAKEYRYLKCAEDEDAICVPYGVQVANSARLRLDKNTGDVEKEIFRKEIQLRIYADDGTYMFGTDSDFINTSVGDTIKGNWIKDKK